VGTVEYVQHVGGDEIFVRAARGTIGTTNMNGGEKLIGGMIRRRHGSIFEHGSLTVRVVAPVFTLREWQRHRIGWSYSELSQRWADASSAAYVPSAGTPLAAIPGSRYGREDAEDPGFDYEARKTIEGQNDRAYETYRRLLHMGVAREVARTVLPMGTFSTMFATCNPRSLMHFLSLRTSSKYSNPQYEIEVLATELERIFEQYWPITRDEFVLNGRVAP